MVIATQLFGRAGIGHHFVATLVSLAFLAVWLLRLSALKLALSGSHATNTQTPRASPSEKALPRYTLIVPLFREAAVLNDLIEALAQLDYPPEKLEIFLVIEEVDTDTKRALEHFDLPNQFKTIIVPDCQPRTKPKAAIYALTFATGEFTVIYDAEDVPEPDQLKRVLQLFAQDSDAGCIQARLAIHNAEESWFTRQFAIEYAALFNCILPALERLEIPIPLGGTSNHFRTSILRSAGAWDPFNVTEDADLGIRLARLDVKARTLSSTTWEEAPATYRAWLGQRERWLKGWMQTFAVHMHCPRKTLTDLGARRFIGLQVLMAGMLLSAFLHPWAYVLGAIHIVQAQSAFSEPSSPWVNVAFWIAWANLIMGYVVTIALGRIAIIDVYDKRLAWHLATMPLYWLLISWAAYRAIFQLATRPYHWHKTAHRGRNEIPNSRIQSPNRS